MTLRGLIAGSAVALTSVTGWPASAQTPDSSFQRIVGAGRPLRVALDHRIRVKTGQPVTATLIDPVYVFDRIVLPAGTKAIGHIEAVEATSRKSRARLMLGGNFTPPHKALLQFDRLVLNDGSTISVLTAASAGTENVRRQMASSSKDAGLAARVREKIASEAKQTVSAVRGPGKRDRLTDMLICVKGTFSGRAGSHNEPFR